MIHRALKAIRQFHGLTQTDLASQMGLSKSYLSEIEGGKKPPSIALLEKYSETFDIPVSSLVFFSEVIGKEGKVPQKFRMVFATKILQIMDWLNNKNDSKNLKA
jgi:transcriptional regulator with XRE-family HTH domain